MSMDTDYPEARERWTLRNQVMDDNETKILSPLKVQSHADCSYFALAVTLESNLRVQWKKNVTLSIKHLKKLYEDSKISMPNVKGKIKRLLSMVKNDGVFEENQYEQIMKGRLQKGDARKYKVINFQAYSMNKKHDIREALHVLRRGGSLLAVIQISDNYHDCYSSGLVYRYDPSRVVTEFGVPATHAVSVVSFGLEAKIPFLECQDSRGKKFGRRGFLCVDITSVKELYSISVRLSS